MCCYTLSMSVPSRSKRNDGAEVEVFTGWVDDSSRSEHPRMATGFSLEPVVNIGFSIFLHFTSL
jgi:hypothetical protein